MNETGKGKKIFFIFYLIAVHLLVALLVYDKFFPFFSAPKNETAQVMPLPTPIEIPSEIAALPANNAVSNQPPPTNANAAVVTENQPENRQITVAATNSGKLMIPVVGIKKENLLDTFNDARSENRVHNAIDIIAPQGTPVVAAADGEIVKFFDSDLGGITIYQLSKDQKYIYYYAHLQKRADNLREKVFVPQGTVIGYVGDTGNAGAGNFHLHFSISIPPDPKRYWEGENINPFPLLKDGVEAQAR